MFKVDSILCPTDFSKPAMEALESAIEISKIFLAKVHVLHVIETSVYPINLGLPAESLAALERESEERTDKEFDKVRAVLKVSGVEYTLSTKRGMPADEVDKYAADNEIDLICIATHGRSGFDRFVFGSVAEKVIRRAPCPVLAIKYKEK